MTEDKDLRLKALTKNTYDPKIHDYNFRFQESKPGGKIEDDFYSAHTTTEAMNMLDYHNRGIERGAKIELDAKILCTNGRKLGYRQFDHKSFREAFIHGDKNQKKMRESFDSFAKYQSPGFSGGLVGQEFTPFLGGPFYKNLYYYTDYIRMHSECFYAYHFDPIAKAFMSITRDFVMGSGYEMQYDTTTRQGQVAQAVWKAFEKVNDLKEQMDNLCIELGVYGEHMIWWLPNNQTKIVYQLNKTDTLPLGMIPRIRIIDPSNIIEIITYPEDITRKLAYIWLTPTQYQIYTSAYDAGTVANQPDEVQPTLKYIYRQIPADQMMHYKINAVSNEKRGRSDYFPILSYLKRIRDSVDFAIINLQKVSAWSIDTTVDGNQADIDAYAQSQAQLGTIPQAGSEFIHSKHITRNYLGNKEASGNMSDAFEWAVSMACAGMVIPFNYLGTHLSGGSTRASAIVATEPVAKKMQKRQDLMKRILSDISERLMKECGLPYVECQIIFPEIITQDRSQKLKDLTLAETNEWIAPETAATIAAKEFAIADYNYQKEMAQYK